MFTEKALRTLSFNDANTSGSLDAAITHYLKYEIEETLAFFAFSSSRTLQLEFTTEAAEKAQRTLSFTKAE